MDENPLPGFEGRDGRKGPAMLEMPASGTAAASTWLSVRFCCRFRRLDLDVFGVTAAVVAKHGKHRTALLQSMRPRAARLHHARYIAAERNGQIPARRIAS
jgi:hypothetical protein